MKHFIYKIMCLSFAAVISVAFLGVDAVTGASGSSGGGTPLASVSTDFDRCAARMERAERSLRRLESIVANAARAISALPHEERTDFDRELQTLENRVEFFRNRFQRSLGQADKIRGDLRDVTGPVCPSCVESSVNLYCRNSESLGSDMEDYIISASEFEKRASEALRKTGGGEPSALPDEADSIRSRLAGLPDSCDDAAAQIMLEQAQVNLNRADSLYRAEKLESAKKALGIARTLLRKAENRCKAE